MTSRKDQREVPTRGQEHYSGAKKADGARDSITRRERFVKGICIGKRDEGG